MVVVLAPAMYNVVAALDPTVNVIVHRYHPLPALMIDVESTEYPVPDAAELATVPVERLKSVLAYMVLLAQQERIKYCRETYLA